MNGMPEWQMWVAGAMLFIAVLALICHAINYLNRRDNPQHIVDIHTFAAVGARYSESVNRTDFTIKFMENETGKRWLSIAGGTFKGPYEFGCIRLVREKWIESREFPSKSACHEERAKHHIMIR